MFQNININSNPKWNIIFLTKDNIIEHMKKLIKSHDYNNIILMLQYYKNIYKQNQDENYIILIEYMKTIKILFSNERNIYDMIN